jgi:hypothetical protein
MSGLLVGGGGGERHKGAMGRRPPAGGVATSGSWALPPHVD